MQRGGAKVTMDNLGGTPLHNAAELGLLKVNCTLDNIVRNFVIYIYVLSYHFGKWVLVH